MLPLQQAYEVRESVMEYLKATFRFKERDVHEEFYRFLEDEKDGLFKGPYISLKTPFVKATPEEEAAIALEIKPSFAPHKHQLKAFERLHTHNKHLPEPTLLTTGTGSGKTECFLYPILDYCYQQNKYNKKRGVKVIIMYPMNALAQDQAKRLAETIWNDERLKGRVDAGLFIGEGDNAAQYPTVMGQDHIIENRKAIIDSQPDIILTNFKMLDFALMKHELQNIWKGNMDDEKQLRFLVLDELHTYDGAQGTDVANLIRRLKLKLQLEEGLLCPIGTSATIGNNADSKEQLCSYASDVFGETFTPDSIIGEDRVKVDDFFPQKLKESLPSEMQIRQCDISSYADVQAYLESLRKIWLPKVSADPYQIGIGLKELKIVRDLLSITGKGILTVKELMDRLDDENREFRSVYRHSKELARKIIESLLALISMAKQDEEGRFPFLFLQVQLWQRELSGILRYVSDKPRFTWRNSIEADDDTVALPMWYCRDCGASGWITSRKMTDRKFCSDITEVNKAFMEHSGDLLLMNTESERHNPIDDFMTECSVNTTHFIHTNDLTDAAETDNKVMEVRVCVKKTAGTGKKPRVQMACPECDAEPIAFIGGKATTLSSVALSQIFASDFETKGTKYRKMLCFTNSVQDAAHQAGFYEARTFRFLFRQSIQQYLKQQSKPISLLELQKGFKKYWKEQLDGDEYYYRMIPADLASRIDLAKDYRKGGDFKDSFKKDFDLRVDWEICSEFGLTAQLGRTLEKTGASATYFPEEKIKEVFDKMVPWLTENQFGYVVEQEKAFCHFLNGILHRIRIHGAVDHPYLELYRTNRLSKADLNWTYNGKYQLNRHFSEKVRFPKVINTGYRHTPNDIVECTSTLNEKRPNWYYRYFLKCLYDVKYNMQGTIDIIAVNEFYQQLFETMVETGLMNKKNAGGGNYALRPESIMVESKVKHIRCDSCQSMLSVAVSDTLSKGTVCLDFKCNSKYMKLENSEYNYYQAVYNRATSPRIYANEHTGLLDREERVRLEESFKKQPKFNSTNTLCATSTLEMGIDIGDLNVVSNTSVPPKPGNFLQRVGRAGRKEGSALVLNYAHSGGTHDMYYFALPKEMMEGEVSTPGCFLEARDILRRHFYAFCIDSWVTADKSSPIPKSMGDDGIMNIGFVDDENAFINRINAFIRQYKLTLMERFRKQYPDKTAEAMDKLAEYISDEGGLIKAIRSTFKTRALAYKHVEEEQNEAQAIKKKMQENDPNYADIIDRLSSLEKQKHNMQDEQVIEFMTNNGLLPNYAFPETGVKLKASVYIHPADKEDTTKSTEIREIELQRPASSGIRELAPKNYFYTQKYRLLISGINNTDWDETLKVMRYCPECDCIADSAEPEYNMSSCPKCGSAKWGGATHKYLRFTEARCITQKRDAALDDRNDDRDSERYHVMKHFMFRDQAGSKAYGLKNVGFGIQFCKDTEITEANYGHISQLGNPTDVNKRRVPGLGFVVCRHCGKATPIMGVGESDPKELHDRFCKRKDGTFPPEPKDKDVFECMYLYHKMQTESIKILLPVQSFMETEASVQLFKAGIELGMRYYYQSSPDHIRIEEYHEKNRITDQMDSYLVMYDTIPGGTGYLSKLFNKQEFGKLMRVAYEHIRDCQCQYEGKDGCYHCILTYGNQYNRRNLSRRLAEELFAKVVDQVELWEDLDDGLGQLKQTGVVESSELERWFVEIMRKEAERHNGWSWQACQDAGDEKYYELVINEGQTQLCYTVRRQYDLGPALGVKERTIPDFQFVCKKAVMDGVEIDNIDEVIPQWSVYTDGYRYHATEECSRFYKDYEKREAIRNRKQSEETGNYKMLSWTLTWDDLDNYQKRGTDEYKGDDLYIPYNRRDQSFANKLQDFSNNMERLLFFLVHPKMENIENEIKLYLANTKTDIDEENMVVKTDFITPTSIIGGALELQITEVGDMVPLVTWKMVQGLHNVDKADWMDFWRRYNILQFFDSEASQIYGDKIASVLDTQNAHDFSEIVQYYPEEYQELVLKACQKGYDIPDDGDFNATDEDGSVIGSAGFGIETEKWVVDPYSDEDRQSFEKHGYQELTVDEAMNKLD